MSSGQQIVQSAYKNKATDALSKTIVVEDVSIDSLLENNLQDMKYNMSGIKSVFKCEIDSFITQTFSENDLTELSIVGSHVNI